MQEYCKKLIMLKLKNIFKRSESRPILVYQMGKVASTSIYNSIASQSRNKVFHLHKLEKCIFDGHDVSIYNDIINKKPKCLIISPIREPVSRNISAFFENFSRFTGVDYKVSRFDTTELLQIFIDKYPHDTPLFWFDNNIYANFNIDVYSKKFPSAGYQFYKNGGVDLLVIKSELPDSIKEEIIQDFTGISSFRLINANISSQKEYSLAYKKFLNDAELPDWYLKKMKESKFYKHFYSNS